MGTFMVAAAVILTLYAFASGVTTMVTHHDVGHHSDVDWMWARVAFQGLAILAVLVILIS